VEPISYATFVEADGDDIEDQLVQIFRAAIRTVRTRQIKHCRIDVRLTASGEFDRSKEDEIPREVRFKRITRGRDIREINDGNDQLAMIKIVE